MYQVIVVVVVFEVFTEFDMDFDLSTSHLLKKNCFFILHHYESSKKRNIQFKRPAHKQLISGREPEN